MRVCLYLGLVGAIVAAGCAGKDTPRPADVAANNLGVGLMGQFKYQEAHDIFAELAEQHPNWVDVKVNLAIATLNRQQEGDEVRALEILKEALALDPDNLRTRYCTGLLMLRAADPAALDQLKYVVDADPSDAYAAYFYASALEQNQRGEEAEAMYRRAIELDPYLRSAYYRLSRILLRAGNRAEAMELQQAFQKLDDNPRARTVDFIYPKMGPKADVLAFGVPQPPPVTPPTGAVFADPAPLLAASDGLTWSIARADRPVSVTACDIDGDGRVDILIPGVLAEGPVANAVIVSAEPAGYALSPGHALASVADVNAALWGDFDNDGLTDAYLCRRGPNQLWRQVEAGTWVDATEPTGTAGGDLDTVDGAFFDADHDGDLDLFCVNADGPNELLSNNLDGTFRPIAQEAMIAGDGRASSQVVVADLDRDRDADIVVINDEPPHEVYINDRLWAYHAGEGFAALVAAPIAAAVPADIDVDGQVELYTRDDAGAISRWVPDDTGTWTGGPAGAGVSHGGRQLAVADFNGDGCLQLWAMDAPGWAPVVIEPERGPSIVSVTPQGVPMLHAPGPGRYPFVAFALSGMEDVGQSMRSNASGLGAHLAVRVESRWTAADTFRSTSGPGQSLQPLAIGLGGDPKLDFVAIDWSDGVYQSEIDLATGQLHEIRETQRQVSSCPVLFAWNGAKYEFVTDLLGVGGIGYLIAPGEYGEPRPWENVELPPGFLQPRHGRFALKLGEPMEEACYLDAAKLVVYDLPPGWSMTLDERMGIAGPPPTGAARFYRDEIPAARAVTNRGEDVTDLLAAADLKPAPVGPLDLRFIGRLAEANVVTLTFDEALDAGPGEPMLVADGWVEYPYSQTMFSAWQARAAFTAPSLEARGSDGRWHVVHDQFGYPAGMPRRMSVPLGALPPGTHDLRLSTNQEISWDRLAVAWAEAAPQVTRRELEPAAADVRRTGFARRTTGDQRQPYYDYDHRPPYWDTRHQRGYYTAFGDVGALVAEPDGALAIFGPGEEVHLEFAAGLEPVAPGWTRRFVLETRGWCKDMDLYTGDGETVGPLPGARDAQGEHLHALYNTRWESGNTAR
jgi:hypothetical protein